jgi:hypothetical protein
MSRKLDFPSSKGFSNIQPALGQRNGAARTHALSTRPPPRKAPAPMARPGRCVPFEDVPLVCSQGTGHPFETCRPHSLQQTCTSEPLLAGEPRQHRQSRAASNPRIHLFNGWGQEIGMVPTPYWQVGALSKRFGSSGPRVHWSLCGPKITKPGAPTLHERKSQVGRKLSSVTEKKS